MIQTIQSLAGIAGLLLGGTYVVGGLIVNLHLSRYAVTEYQIVRAKYLAVGLVFLINSVFSLTLAALPAILLSGLPVFAHQVAFAVTLLAFVWVLRLWNWPERAGRLVTRWPWRMWVILNLLMGIFPLLAIFRLSVTRIVTPADMIFAVESGIGAVLLLTGQVYYYAQHLYGHTDQSDPIGSGILVAIQLSGQKDDIKHLGLLGVPILQPTLTAPVALIDETADHYLIGIEHAGAIRAIKIRKDIVQAILYLGYGQPAPAPEPSLGDE